MHVRIHIHIEYFTLEPLLSKPGVRMAFVIFYPHLMDYTKGHIRMEHFILYYR